MEKARKLGVGIQSFLCTVGDFLNSYSGIAEIVKSADEQFGGLAYGTVALVVAVAVLKQQREESIERVLEELSHAFPRLNTLQELDPGPQLKQPIVSVFELSIIFYRETITYFTEPRRLLKAMSPSEIKMETVCKLRMTLLEVCKECEIFMLQKLENVASELRRIKLELQEMTIRLEAVSDTTGSIEIRGLDTNVRVQENQWRLRQDAESRAKSKALSELKGQMQLKNVEEQPILDVASSVKQVLTAGLSQRRRKTRGPLQQISKAMLMQDGNFLSWSEEKTLQCSFLLERTMGIAYQ
ncbi:hypothetical protein COCVIDRAFT_31240 [Bipolaris victoriae FI3]|uniref:DUF7708 domain-containing protein n=1 Tax=Bipolaris victoriae (strain FI3) TaxID=930091 RepID=W7DZP1_BIPV3|nr:hypothetical protein COCVIDRAFT_31240 [Bipolaris victoriae FI3]